MFSAFKDQKTFCLVSSNFVTLCHTMWIILIPLLFASQCEYKKIIWSTAKNIDLEPMFLGAVVVAQLVERSPLSPEIRGSNPVIGKLLSNICLLSTVSKDENKEKECGNGPFFKKEDISN